MRNEQVDAFGVLLHRHGVNLVPRQVAHRTVGFGHDQRFVPVVSGGADDFIEAFGRAVAADLVDPGDGEVLETLHQVAGDGDRVHHFLLVLMAHGGDAVGGTPVLDTLGETGRIQLGSEAEQVVPGGLRIRTDVAP